MSTKNEDESAKIRLSRQYLKNEADDREEAKVDPVRFQKTTL